MPDDGFFVLLQIMVYLFVRYLIGEIDCVQSFESNSVTGGDTEDTAVALLKFQNESLGTLSVSDTIISPWS